MPVREKMLNRMRQNRSNRTCLVYVSWGVFCFVIIWYIVIMSNVTITQIPSITRALTETQQKPNINDPISDSERTVQNKILNIASKIQDFHDSEVKLGEAVFFIITAKVKNDHSLPINARQACGIESAAWNHPEKDVFVLIVTPENIVELHSDGNPIITSLLQYPNIKMRIFRAQSFLMGTPAGALLNKLKISDYPVEHTSDLLRYALLYKFGGLYLDTDVMLIKRMPAYNNYIGVESEMYCGAGIFHFSIDRVGREMANDTISELVRTYNPKAYATSGPEVVTNVLRKRCGKPLPAKILDDVTKIKVCDGYTITPEYVFYGISFKDRKLFFQLGQTPKVTNLLSSTTTVHYWNHLTAAMPANVPGIPFYDIAQTQCPKIHYKARHLF